MKGFVEFCWLNYFLKLFEPRSDIYWKNLNFEVRWLVSCNCAWCFCFLAWLWMNVWHLPNALKMILKE